MRSHRLSVPFILGAPLALAGHALHAQLLPRCTLQLQVQFSPEVPDARVLNVRVIGHAAPAGA